MILFVHLWKVDVDAQLFQARSAIATAQFIPREIRRVSCHVTFIYLSLLSLSPLFLSMRSLASTSSLLTNKTHYDPYARSALVPIAARQTNCVDHLPNASASSKVKKKRSIQTITMRREVSTYKGGPLTLPGFLNLIS